MPDTRSECVVPLTLSVYSIILHYQQSQTPGRYFNHLNTIALDWRSREAKRTATIHLQLPTSGLFKNMKKGLMVNSFFAPSISIVYFSAIAVACSLSARSNAGQSKVS